MLPWSNTIDTVNRTERLGSGTMKLGWSRVVKRHRQNPQLGRPWRLLVSPQTPYEHNYEERFNLKSKWRRVKFTIITDTYTGGEAQTGWRREPDALLWIRQRANNDWLRWKVNLVLTVTESFDTFVWMESGGGGFTTSPEIRRKENYKWGIKISVVDASVW